MSFSSFEFAIFLPIVFCLYWLLSGSGTKAQNILLIIASYYFYGWWDWRFLVLIALSTFFDYFIGIEISKSKKESIRKALLLTTLTLNIGLLFTFKYFNFFLSSFYGIFSLFGQPLNKSLAINLVLPVGISFYTFQTLSYSIDIYRNKLEPTSDIISFFAFVSFFPQLVAGPIERAANLLPFFHENRVFKYDEMTYGMRQILWGIFKKIVIANTCSIYVDNIFENYSEYGSSTLLLGAFFFSFQIYGDFSGYSDIAIGTAHLFGIKLTRNFSYPYFSRNIAEFWRRWHISLSTWFRDYVYIPLGGNRDRIWISIRNIFITFLLSGLWHGANWTFIMWGVLNAVYLLPSSIFNNNKFRKTKDIVAKGKLIPSLKESIQMGITFGLVSITWIFFRAESVGHAISYLSRMFSTSIFSIPEIFPIRLILLVALFVLVEWFQREHNNVLQSLTKDLSFILRWIVYYLIIGMAWFSSSRHTEFIYFQF